MRGGLLAPISTDKVLSERGVLSDRSDSRGTRSPRFEKPETLVKLVEFCSLS